MIFFPCWQQWDLLLIMKKLADVALLPFYCQNTLVALLLINFKLARSYIFKMKITCIKKRFYNFQIKVKLCNAACYVPSFIPGVANLFSKWAKFQVYKCWRAKKGIFSIIPIGKSLIIYSENFEKNLCRAIQNVQAGQKWPAGRGLAAPALYKHQRQIIQQKLRRDS